MKDSTIRRDFAGFLERLASGRTYPGDWVEYVINHYMDELVEEIRAGCARLATDEKLPPTTDAHRQQLLAWVEELRNAA